MTLESRAGNADVTGLDIHHGSDGPSAPSVSRAPAGGWQALYLLPVSAPHIGSLVLVQHIRLCLHRHRPSSPRSTQYTLSTCPCPNLPFALRTPGIRLRATLPQHDPYFQIHSRSQYWDLEREGGTRGRVQPWLPGSI